MKSKVQGGFRLIIFWLLDILPKITDATNGEMYTLFTGVCLTLNSKKEKKKGVMKSKELGGCQGTIFRLLDILPKMTDRTIGEMYTLFIWVCLTLNQKKKVVGKSKGRGCCRVTIFWLLDILPKITYGTNCEMYTLFRGVFKSLNQKEKKKNKVVVKS